MIKHIISKKYKQKASNYFIVVVLDLIRTHLRHFKYIYRIFLRTPYESSKTIRLVMTHLINMNGKLFLIFAHL